MSHFIAFERKQPRRARASKRRWPVVAAVFLLPAALFIFPPFPSTAARQPENRPRYQAVWVDAFHDGFKTPEQTRRLIAWARRHFVNALFIEVRKTADAYYNSRVEPKAPDIRPANYDPLADLIALAHDTRGGRQRIEIHAWLIVYRVGTGKPLPKNHVARRRPEWLSRTYGGRRSSEEGHIFLDPGVPEVIDHTALVVADLVSRYDLDGIHFDRIRYPSKMWGYNPIAVKRFKRVARRWRKPRPSDPAWAWFRRQQVTAMLRRLYITAKSRRPAIKVSAATVAFDECRSDFRKTRAFADVFQDWRRWALGGWLDINCLMIYKRDWVADQARQYREWLDFLAANRGLSQAVVGQGSYLNTPSGSLRQISLASQHPQIAGVSLFSYAQMARAGEHPEIFAQSLRRYFHPRTHPPSPRSPERGGFGWIAGNVIGPEHDTVAVALSGTDPPRKTLTDGSGFFAFTYVPAGTYELSVSTGGRSKNVKKVRVEAGKVAWVRLAP